LSEDQEERIEIDIDNNNGNFEESSEIAEPLEIIREEVAEVVQNPNGETSLSSLSVSSPSTEEQEEEGNEVISDNRNSDNEDIHEQIKAQSIQLDKLIKMVESLQSQVKHLQETIRLRKRNKTSSVRKKSTTNKGIKTNRRASARSRRK
jgi:DNA-directed RNA polymerase specialized sigma subunit